VWDLFEEPFIYLVIPGLLLVVLIYILIFFMRRLRFLGGLMTSAEQFHSSLDTSEILLKAEHLITEQDKELYLKPLMIDRVRNEVWFCEPGVVGSDPIPFSRESMLFQSCLLNRPVLCRKERLKSATDLALSERTGLAEFLLYPVMLEKIQFYQEGVGRLVRRCYGGHRCMRGEQEKPLDEWYRDCYDCTYFSPFGAFMVGRRKGKLRNRDIRRVKAVLSQRAFISALSNAARYEQARSLITKDELTGAVNYRGLIELLNRELVRAKRERRSLGLLFIDIDNFGEYNKARGHLTGNRFLKRLSQSISYGVRKSDYVARFGGDEFVAILPGSDRKGCEETLGRIRRQIKLTLGEDECGVSMGIAVYPDDGTTFEELLERADRRMRSEKRSSLMMEDGI